MHNHEGAYDEGGAGRARGLINSTPSPLALISVVLPVLTVCLYVSL